MNYIPGFSNYLETSVPRYAVGGEVMGGVALTPEEREARRIAANTLPPGTSIVGPTAGKNPLAFGTDNTFRVGEGQEIRVVDAGGNVIFSGSGVDGANRAVAVAQSLSNDLGKDANFKIQTGERTINPDGSVGGTRYIDVARAAPMQTGLGFLADNVLPFAAAFIPGVGPVAGAALGSLASSGLQGRGLKDALVRAAIAGGSAYAGGQLFGPVTPGAATPTDLVNSDLIPNALGGLNFGSVASTAIPAGVGGAAGDIIVNSLGRVVPSLVGSAVGGALPSALNPIATDFSSKGGLPETLTTETTPVEEIVVTGSELETLTPDELMATLGGVGNLATTTTTTTTGGDATDPATTDKDGNKLGVEEYLRLLALGVGAVGGGGGGSGSPGTYTPGGRGLDPIFSAQLPTAGGLGTNRTARPLGNVDWLTYGTRPELNFFDYSTPTNPAPVTTPVPNNPAGPAMYVPDDMRFAEGGAFAAKRGGSSDRTEFAVNGPGTGRSDDIPAVLSDGEYVIDAETVALLGDGSSKAGAKKLDDLRVKVRKHKGKKLAKGRFSANAKKPEAYLSGGRI